MAYSSGLHMLLMFLLGLSATRSVLGLTFGFPYGKEKVRGVNLGGWLVLEVGTRVCSLDCKNMMANCIPALDYAVPL